MINIKKILIASIAALSASAALAHDKGFYIGGGYGYTEADNFCQNLSGASCDNDDNSWNVFGGYQFNRNFAVEAGYSELGHVDASLSGVASGDADADSYDLSVLGILPLGDMLSVYARGGYSLVDVDATFNLAGPGGVSNDDDNVGSWVYGLGAGLNVTDNVEVRADWRRFHDVDDNNSLSFASGNIDLDVYSLQAVYHFGPHSAPVPAEQVSLNIQVLFDTDKSVIKPEFAGEVQKAADFLTAHPEARAVIEGHTDSTASDSYNQGLSERRANSVMSALIAKGIDASRLSAVGYGESKPVADNATREGRAQNRRVVAEFEGVSIKAE